MKYSTGSTISSKIIKRKLQSTKVFPPFLIILTFTIFVIGPDTANLFLFYISDTGTNFHANILLTFYVLGFISDALIYTFLLTTLRTVFDVDSRKISTPPAHTIDIDARNIPVIWRR